MLAALFVERFNLKAHYEKRDLPVFELRTLRGDDRLGPSLKRAPADIDCAALRLAGKLSRPSAPPAPGKVSPCMFLIYPGRIVAGTMPMAALASFLSNQVERFVIDRTPYEDRFDFELTWTPESVATAGPSAANAPPPQGGGVASDPPSLITALREQLGLRLESATAPTSVLVIDSITRPTPD
jgi:uncharacterized protein (TIGR03435 family)